MADPAAPGGFSYSGAPVSFDAAGVLPLAEPAALASLTDPSQATARQLATTFCVCYRQMLTALQQAYSGQPGMLGNAISLMRIKLKSAARSMLATPDPNDPSRRLTPSWEYLPDPLPLS